MPIAAAPDSALLIPELLYDRAFPSSASFKMDAEDGTHSPFLEQLFMACSPLRDLLSGEMLRQQALAQRMGHRAQHPEATSRIVSDGERPVGRILIDWSRRKTSRCVDIAVLPEYQRRGIGTSMLRRWVDVADSQAQICTLSVLRAAPAACLYARLGFIPEAGDDGDSPLVEMVRNPGDCPS